MKKKNARRAMRTTGQKTKTIAVHRIIPRPAPAIGGRAWRRKNGLATVRDDVRLYLATHYTPAGALCPLPKCRKPGGRRR